MFEYLKCFFVYSRYNKGLVKNYYDAIVEIDKEIGIDYLVCAHNLYEAIKAGQQVKKYNKISDSGSDTRMAAKMFFLGVRDELSLKKRYRDLLKLFHPDSMNGDVHAMQAINKEYEEIKRAYDI